MGLVFVLAPACGEKLPTASSVAPSSAPSRGLFVQFPGPDAGAVHTDGAASAEPLTSSSSASASIRRMLPRVERLRGLRATRDVPGMAVDRRSLMLRVRQHVARELPQEAIRNEGRELELLGLLPIGFDYEAAEYKLLEDQLAGYYEPADHTMYLASDLDEQDSDATLAHELVHALQDQRWHLDSLSRYRPGESDVAEAISALAEGDATSAMLDFVIESTLPGSGKRAPDMPDDVCAAQFRQSLERGKSSSLPGIMTGSLLAPYQYGTLFINALRRAGGWEAVNRAWSELPTTTEQILHIDKWLSREPAMTVKAPPFASLGPEWQAIDEDTEGELGTRVAFEQWIGAQSAADCSAHWGGDRGVLIQRGDRTAFAWRLRYDPGTIASEHAARAFAALSAAFERIHGAPKLRAKSLVCHERHRRGPLALAADGSDLLIVAGPDRVPALGEETGDETCRLSQTWIHEIEAER